MEWRETGRDQSYSQIAGMDPSADWILGPGFKDLCRGDEEVLIPFSVGPIGKETLEFIRSAEKDAGKPTGIFIPELYRGAEEGYLVGFAKRSFFEELRDGSLFPQLKDMSKHIDLSLPLRAKSLPESWTLGKPAPPLLDPPVYSPHPTGWPSDTVVVGIIDDGIRLAHERFRLPDGTTRVQYSWRQDAVYDGLGSTVVGREICKLDLPHRDGIDSLLQAHTQAGLVDEERLYREAGLIDFRDRDHKAAALRTAHGTHVLDLAAGYDPRHALMKLSVPIIAVQLPVSVTEDTSGSKLTAYTAAAIHYIVDRADRLAGNGPRLPIVINFSYGMLAGPHDGSLHIEQIMDGFIASRPTPMRIVLPAGNANLSRCHVECGFDKPTETLSWRVPPDDQTPTQMEIWLPHEASTPGASRVSICINHHPGNAAPLSAKRSAGVSN